MQEKRWRLAIKMSKNLAFVSRSEKLMKIAVLVETRNIAEIDKVLKHEMEVHGNKGKTICCLKVSANYNMYKVCFLNEN